MKFSTCRTIACIALVIVLAVSVAAQAASRPNVLLIITDDQGWGDFGFHGNPHLKTPHLDRLAGQSTELTQFYVCPVCSPTRASLLTGRYNYRTGVVDTFLGRSTMAGDEVTLAEMFATAGYRTGIFGKWHLGDNYPSRPTDQGFQEALVHRGGGIAQPAGPPGDHYFDPWLMHNNREFQAKGYCSDIFTDAAMAFISQKNEQPFFAYLAYNCPHTPLELPQEYAARYEGKSLDDTTTKVYGMIANIDDNLGRLFARLTDLKLDDDTIVIFLTDNGPQQPRYNGKWRDLKGTVYEGGIHVPCLVRWPGKVSPGARLAQVSAHIDIAPTLLDACQIQPPSGARFDGRSLLGPLRTGGVQASERMLFFQWHRGDQPDRYRACAVRGPRYKLVQPLGRGERENFTPHWALYDLEADPGEQHDLIESRPQLAAEMKAAYDRWLDDVGNTRGYPAPRIIVGTDRENPVTLTRQDWRGARASWGENGLGNWQIDVAAAGSVDFTLRMPKLEQAGTARLRLGATVLEHPVAAGDTQAIFRPVKVEPGTVSVEGSVVVGARVAGVHYVDLLWHAPAR